MSLKKMRGDWALITGASSGIGAEFCRQLAEYGIHLVMVARNAQRLTVLSESLEQKYGVKTLVLPIDLSEMEAAEKIYKIIDDRAIRIRLLVNNAALSYAGNFEDSSSSNYAKMIQVNCVAPVTLSFNLLPHLKSHESSVILNVSSGAAYQPIPYMGVYAATKSFMQNFSLALYGELTSLGIIVRTFVPGPTNTEISSNDTYTGKMESVETTVSRALQKFGFDDPLLITAKGIFLQKLFSFLIPTKILIKEAGSMFKPKKGGKAEPKFKNPG